MEPAVYFGASPIGLWSLRAHKDDTCEGGSFCNDRGSARVRGIATPDFENETDPKLFNFANCTSQDAMTERLYGHAQFCNGQADDAASCKQINGYSTMVLCNFFRNFDFRAL